MPVLERPGERHGFGNVSFHVSRGYDVRVMTGINRLLIGQIALERGFITAARLREALDLQAGQPLPKPLGTILVESRFITTAQLLEAVDEQVRRLKEGLAYVDAEKRELAFGRLLVRYGHVPEMRVNEALNVQQDLAERGIRKRLGQILVEAGHLRPAVVLELLAIQGKVLMSCTFCGTHQNVLKSISDKAACPKCGMPMQSYSVEVAAQPDTAYLLPHVDISTLRRAAIRDPLPEPVPPPAPPPAIPEPALEAPPPRRRGWSGVILTIVVLILLLLLALSR